MNRETSKAATSNDFRVYILVCIPIFWLIFQALGDWQRTYREEHRSFNHYWDPSNLIISGSSQNQELSLLAVFDLQNIPVNTAGEELLTTIPGVGPELARRIVARRTDSGPYQMAADLTRVTGIGPRRAEQITPYLSFD